MILGKFYFIYEKLIKIQSLYNNGLRGGNKDVYLELDSVAKYIDGLDKNYFVKLDIGKKFKAILEFSDLSMDIIRLKYIIDHPDDDIIGIVQATEKQLKDLFNEINKFLEKQLPIMIDNLRSLLDNHTFIDLNKFIIDINEGHIKVIKDAILFKIKNAYDSFTHKTLELYYYPSGELGDAPFNRLKWYQNNSDINTPTAYSEYILENLSVNKLVEIVSDFNIDIKKCELQLKKNIT